MGTARMELKLAQELASLDQYPLLLVFLDLSKAYDNLDQGRPLQTLAGYVAGPKPRGLLAEIWSRHKLVTFQNGLHGPQFQYTRGMAHGRLALPTLFSMAVDSVVRHWLSLTVEDDSDTHDGLRCR